MCHFKDLGAESLAKRQVEILTFFGEVEKAYASHGQVDELKVTSLDEQTRKELEAMGDTPFPHSPTHVRRHSGSGTTELVVTAESMPGAPVLSQLDLQRAHSFVHHSGGKDKDTGVGSSTGVDHIQVPEPTKHERDQVDKMPDSPHPAPEQSGFAK